MARLLVRTVPHKRGEISAVLENDAPAGVQIDPALYLAKFGNMAGFRRSHIIVDIHDMSMGEGRRLMAPVITQQAGPIDDLTGQATIVDTIHHNSKGLIDYNAMANTPPRRDDLNNNAHIKRTHGESLAHITERGAPS